MSTETTFDPVTGEVRDGSSNIAEISVSELSHALKRTIEDRFGYVRLRGEISGYKGAHSSGHCYFAIKDHSAKIDAVIWRGTFSRVKSKLADGLEVIVTGKVTTFPGKSSYQIVVETVEPAGAGALMALLEERKKKLAAEGLFDGSRKRELPHLPELVGVVTSPTGAVIRDILHRLNDRFPRHVIVWPVRVQGETAAGEIAAAIVGFNALAKKPDVLIVARGGGSIEDLRPFNEEIVVRAAAASRIPLISAVGHETDTTLIDFVSDWRAPTPTAAAERAVPVRVELLAAVGSIEARQRRAMVRMAQQARMALTSASRGLPKRDDLLATPRQQLDSVSMRLPRSLSTNVQRHAIALTRAAGRLSVTMVSERLMQLRRRLPELDIRRKRAMAQLIGKRADALASEWKVLRTVSYQATLERGFAIIKDEKGHTLQRAAEAKAGKNIEIRFADGDLPATIGPPSRQGSLF